MSEAPEDMVRLDPWERHLTEPVRGRKVIIAFEVLAGMTGLVQQLARWGSRPPLLIPDGRGTGAIPPVEAGEVVMLDETRVESLTDQVRARMAPDEQLTAAGPRRGRALRPGPHRRVVGQPDRSERADAGA